MSKQALITPKLYLLTNDDRFELLITKLEIALATGTVGLLQIRRKKILASTDGTAQLYKEALQIVALARRYDVSVVVNDDIKLASKLGAGVHLGQGDGSIIEAKQLLKPDQIIGRTCHDKVNLVIEADSDGANYAAIGAVFVSTTKPNAKPVERSALVAACQQDIDICVIGGLTAENVCELKGLPIRYVAVVGDVMDLATDKIAKRCLQWQAVLETWYNDI